MQLAQWVNSQRTYAKNFIEGNEGRKPSTSAEKIARLHSIGFLFTVTKHNLAVEKYLKRLDSTKRTGSKPTAPQHQQLIWEQRFGELIQYKKRFGDTRIPATWPENQQLASWTRSQRGYFRNFVNGKKYAFITEEKIVKLRSIGFDFNPGGMDKASERYFKTGIITSLKSEERGNEEDYHAPPAKHSTKSGRAVKKPRKMEDVYSYEYIQKVGKKARLEEDYSSDDGKAQLFASFDEIPFDQAAVSTLNNNVAKADSMLLDKNSGDEDGHDDEKEWLEKVAVQLGADTSTLQRQKMYVRNARSTSSSLSLDRYKGRQPSMKSDVASICSSSTYTADNTTSKTYHGGASLKQPPESVLVSQPKPTVAYSSLSLLSDIAEGDRHGRLVFWKNDGSSKIGETIMEKDATWVEVIIDGTVKKYRASQLLVVPSDKYKIGDTGPSSPQKESCDKSSSRSEKKSGPTLSAAAVDNLFCWFCDDCDTNNKVCDSFCHSCKTLRGEQATRSALLEIVDKVVEKALDDTTITVKEAMKSISSSERPSIPEELIVYILNLFSGKEVEFPDLSCDVETYFYWLCGSCKMQNSYNRSICAACTQDKSLSERSPLLKVAEEAAMNCESTDDALSQVPKRERALITRVVLDGLVSCVFMIEGRNGQLRRCRKHKKEGYDYCESHIHPSLVKEPPNDLLESIPEESLPQEDDESLSNESQENGEVGPTSQSKIAAISEMLPSFLSGMEQPLDNSNRWTINCIEDSLLAAGGAFPLGMKVRRFFPGYGFHDGRTIKVVVSITPMQICIIF